MMLAVVACVLAPLVVHAEGEDPDAPPKPKAVHHKVVKKKPAAAAAAPSGPIPYTTLNPAAAQTVVKVLPPPVAVTPVPVPPPPPPPPSVMTQSAPQPAVPPQAQATPAIHAREINLKCQTVTMNGKKALTSGTFYIDLFPSQIFPDEQADFKFNQVDPQHASLVRESDCLDTICDAKVSGSAYFLVNRVTRHGKALRITLNRANGAFYAEAIDPKGIALHPGEHIGESGWCVPQQLPNAMF